MKVSVRDIANKEVGSIDLPQQFDEDYRPDLIQRAVLSLQSRARQPYGTDPMAGKKSSAELSRRRRKYRGSYGFGISRVPRKILTRRGTRMYWVGAFAPGTVGGRRAHPPKAEKIWEQKINKTENRKAIRSALAATMNKDLVLARGHKIPKEYPFIISDDFEKIAKTREVMAAFAKLSFGEELERADQKKVRAGKGKLRGRKYKRRVGPLVVVSSDEAQIVKSARNIPGVNVATVDELNADILAPGTHAGRAALFTESAIKRITSEGLFLKEMMVKRAAPKKEAKAPVKTVKKATKKAVKKTPAKTPKKTPKKVAA